MRLKDVQVEWPGLRPPTAVELDLYDTAARRYLRIRGVPRIVGVVDHPGWFDGRGGHSWIVVVRPPKGAPWVASLWRSQGGDPPVLTNWNYLPTLQQVQEYLPDLLQQWLAGTGGREP